jgi:hypothetical protein
VVAVLPWARAQSGRERPCSRRPPTWHPERRKGRPPLRANGGRSVHPPHENGIVCAHTLTAFSEDQIFSIWRNITSQGPVKPGRISLVRLSRTKTEHSKLSVLHSQEQRYTGRTRNFENFASIESFACGCGSGSLLDHQLLNARKQCEGAFYQPPKP